MCKCFAKLLVQCFSKQGKGIRKTGEDHDINETMFKILYFTFYRKLDPGRHSSSLSQWWVAWQLCTFSPMTDKRFLWLVVLVICNSISGRLTAMADRCDWSRDCHDWHIIVIGGLSHLQLRDWPPHSHDWQSIVISGLSHLQLRDWPAHSHDWQIIVIGDLSLYSSPWLVASQPWLPWSNNDDRKLRKHVVFATV